MTTDTTAIRARLDAARIYGACEICGAPVPIARRAFRLRRKLGPYLAQWSCPRWHSRYRRWPAETVTVTVWL